ncbi:hypothetical protein Q0Z83_031540 [Actinoplanes sichuanensis]|nr:hypothetical protein Q0Z83_031540 [Actinoplanes sichuanensis]
MLTIRPVIEVDPWALAETTGGEVLDDGPGGPTLRQRSPLRPADGPQPWRTASPPAWSWLPLDGRRTPAEVALLIAAVAAATHPAEDDPAETRTARAPEDWPGPAINRLLAAPDLIVAGGLQVHDSTSAVTVTPGCCCGLETWREWPALLGGTPPWLGHDPTPTFQDLGPYLRLWQNDGARGPYLDIPRADLPALLAQAHHDLNAFLPLTGAWATTWTATHGPATLDGGPDPATETPGPALMAALDRGFAVTAPLEFPCDTATPAPPT